MATIQQKKVVTIYDTESVFNKLIIAAFVTSCDKWETLQSEFCENLNCTQEVRMIDRVAKVFGINPAQYDYKPYGELLYKIWYEAKNYSITAICE